MRKYSSLVYVLLFTASTSFTVNAQIQKGADIDGEMSSDHSGSSVSMPDANTIAISAPYKHITTGNGAAYGGQVRVFTWSGSVWQQVGYSIDGNTAEEYLGASVCMPDVNTIAVGSPRINAYSGMVQVMTPTGANWILKGRALVGETAGDYFGQSISMPDANTIAIGAPQNDGNGSNSGHVRIYSWNGTNWTQKGADIDGEATDDNSGYSINMPDANTVAIGANGNDGNGTDAGHVRIYTWNGTTWIQKGIDIDGEAAGDNLGYSVSMPDVNTLAVGAPYNDDSALNSGHVRIYTWNGTTWIQKGIDINGEATDDYSGNSISMPDANTVAVGAYRNDANGTNAGQVRIFRWSGSVWAQDGADIVGEAAGDASGSSVSMPDAYTLAVGAPLNDALSQDAGHTRVYVFSPVGIDESSIDYMNIQPNPANNIITVTCSVPTVAVITSVTGAFMTNLDLTGETTIDVSNYTPGIYFIRNSKGHTLKFIKE